MPKGPEYTFDRTAEEEFPDAEKIGLPEKVERDLISEKLGSPLNIMVDSFRRAGIPEDELKQYIAATKASFERKTVVGMGEKAFFAIQKHYLAPHIQLNENLSPLPDFLHGTALKPKLGKKGGVSMSSEAIHGSQIIERMSGTEHLENEKRTTVSPIERVSVTINRFMYALHEPLHMTQIIMYGDQLNRLKDTLSIGDLIDPEKEHQYLENANFPNTNFEWEKPDWVNQSLFILPERYDAKYMQETGLNWKRITVANDEATIDALQDQAVRGYIREHPEVVLWVHNMLSLQFEALRALRENIYDDVQSDKKNGHTT